MGQQQQQQTPMDDHVSSNNNYNTTTTRAIIMTWTRTRIADEVVVQSLNERHLNQDRSLPRPQNKAVATAELELLQELLLQQPHLSLDQYLSTYHGLSPN
jgi:hypothetical protein